MWAPDVIRRTRAGEPVSVNEVQSLLEGFVREEVLPEQMSAWAMAVCFRGLPREHVVALTVAMRDSGHCFRWPDDGRPTVDKHSTGGVGDKVSLALAPLVAACGRRVPMISGRGLGHTGGTLDKLSCIPGFESRLDVDRFRDVVERCGFVMAGQSYDVAPADRRLYALRDATGTVESIPLITASILSKKLAEGLDALVLDVKVGSGAFMKTRTDGELLAESLVSVSTQLGCQTTAVLTDMNVPIGRTVGNANELDEAMACLRGEGPPDLDELVLELGSHLLGSDGRQELERARASGAGLRAMERVVEAQGGNVEMLHRPGAWRRHVQEQVISAAQPGVLAAFDAAKVGMAAMYLGAGRRRPEDEIDPLAGIDLFVSLGETVEEGQPIARLVARSREGFPAAVASFQESLEWTQEPVERHPSLILGYHTHA
ncbi:MAG: thymidine phosphorylase [Myxococcota bacterium]